LLIHFDSLQHGDTEKWFQSQAAWLESWPCTLTAETLDRLFNLGIPGSRPMEKDVMIVPPSKS